MLHTFKYFSFFVGLFWSCSSCQNNPNNDLIAGEWVGNSVMEADLPMKVNPKELKLVFNTSDQYQYFSTLGYQEAGYYSIDFPYLYTKDTLQEGTVQKVVEIIQLNNDTLGIRMQEKDKTRIVTFSKQPSN